MIEELKEKYKIYKKARTIQAPGKIFTDDTLWEWLKVNIPLDAEVKPANDVIKIIDEFIERDKKLAEIFDNDDWHCSKAYNEAYSSRVTIVLNELKNRLSV